MAGTVDVEALTADLYTVAPEEFVAARREGAQKLKAAGDPDAAAAFAKLPKPSVPAWAVNVLAARRPQLIDDLVERGDELRKAHAGGGEAAEIRAAQRARQQAIRAAADAAAELSGRRLSDAHREAIAATLEAASTDPTAVGEVRRGQLVRALEAPTGFDALGGLTLVPGGRRGRSPAAATDRRRARPPDSDTDEEVERDAEREILLADAEAARRAAEAATAAAAELGEQIATLEQQRQQVDEELRRLDAELGAKRRELREADRAAADASRKAERIAARAKRGAVTLL